MNVADLVHCRVRLGGYFRAEGPVSQQNGQQAKDIGDASRSRSSQGYCLASQLIK